MLNHCSSKGTKVTTWVQQCFMHEYNTPAKGICIARYILATLSDLPLLPQLITLKMASKMLMLHWKHEPLSESFKGFKTRLNLYFTHQEISNDTRQTMKLQMTVGDEAMWHIQSSSVSEDDKNDTKIISELFEGQLNGSVDISSWVHCLEFQTLHQKSEELTVPQGSLVCI